MTVPLFAITDYPAVYEADMSPCVTEVSTVHVGGENVLLVLVEFEVALLLEVVFNEVVSLVDEEEELLEVVFVEFDVLSEELLVRLELLVFELLDAFEEFEEELLVELVFDVLVLVVVAITVPLLAIVDKPVCEVVDTSF
jgi:hypothetical protein